ncbi:polyphosphate kinase 1, partial [bacterium]|nr:polyphosphate kinase 1 [bacterium]
MSPAEELAACLAEALQQTRMLSDLVQDEIRPALAAAGIPIFEFSQLKERQRRHLEQYFQETVLPTLTPLAVDAEHPFPFISSLCINLAVQVQQAGKKKPRFVRIKVPDNLPRWVELPQAAGFVPLEQVIAANVSHFFTDSDRIETYFFRVTRGGKSEQPVSGEIDSPDGLDASLDPGSIISSVTNELKARRFAGIVRLQVSSGMPRDLQDWLTVKLGAEALDIYETDNLLQLADLLPFAATGHAELRDPPHVPVTHPRLRGLPPDDPGAIFDVIRSGDLLVHHPYHSFDTSVLLFLQSAAVDPKVLAIKLTIYRTASGKSPVVQALIEAARRGKQVAVLVEITARFDEAPNIAWGKLLEEAGAHVAYGVEKLKTHVKLALVVREEEDGIRRYVHVGTGNYHPGTARIYEDVGMLSCDPELGADVAAVFNELTSAAKKNGYKKLIVAPNNMRDCFVELIRAEAKNARAGRPAGIRAKMNQLQDPQIIHELYLASQAGVEIVLNVRGLCCLRPGVKGLSENIRVFSIIGRFLEHSRIYRFTNGGDPQLFIGSADWMRRNLNRRVETITPVTSHALKIELDEILAVYETDNTSAWDLQPDGSYAVKRPIDGQEPLSAHQCFIDLAGEEPSA